MQILELQLFSTNLNAQEEVLGNKLGFPIETKEDQLIIFCGENKLIFQKSERQFYYHYCFLIPTGSLESAIIFLDEKRFDPVPYEGERIIHFDNGRSVYFYDGDGNIAEFIERPLTNYSEKDTFKIEDVIKLNEIGLPVTSPLDTSEELISKYSIVPLSQETFRDDFCWVGDHHGVILVTKIGRNWMPTQRQAEVNDLAIRYSDGGDEKHLRFENNRIIQLS